MRLISWFNALALSVLLVACDATAPDSSSRSRAPSSSPKAAGNSVIAFLSQRRGEPRAWVSVVPASGGEVTRLREGRDPSWSPDGEKLVFACHPGICTMDADGTRVRRLTRPTGDTIDEGPTWGPDGLIAFTRSYFDGTRGPDILLVRSDGRGRERPLITKGSNFSATWSPDGDSLALIRGLGPFLEAPTGGFQLWTIDVGGKELRKLTTTGASRPDWSPDGSEILFDNASALWIIPAHGGNPRKLEPATTGEHPLTGAFASWSPDGTRIVYTCEVRGFDSNDLCVMNPDGAGRTTVLATRASESLPAWQPVRV